LFDVEFNAKASSSTTFIDNMKLPIHRWFRYSAGFSAEWVKHIIKKHSKTNSIMLDRFAGSGTTLVAANELNVPSIGYEKHYFVHRLANTKLHYTVSFNHLEKLYKKIISQSQFSCFDFETQPDLLKRCYSPEILKKLVSIKANYFQISDIFLTIHFQKSGKLNSRSVLKDMTEDGRRSSALGLQEMNTFYRGADKSLALPGRKQSRKHVTDARDFNNIETRAVIKFFFLQGKAPKEIHAIMTETLACFLPGRAKDLSSPLY
jgi:hypothetical protein